MAPVACMSRYSFAAAGQGVALAERESLAWPSRMTSITFQPRRRTTRVESGQVSLLSICRTLHKSFITWPTRYRYPPRWKHAARHVLSAALVSRRRNENSAVCVENVRRETSHRCFFSHLDRESFLQVSLERRIVKTIARRKYVNISIES